MADPAHAAAVAPLMSAGDAVASAFGHQARVAQMTEALVAVRPVLVRIKQASDFEIERALHLLDAALTAAPVREVRYGRWSIRHMPPPNSDGRRDWSYLHDDHSGAEDPRAGTTGSIAQAMALIDELEGQ